MERTEQFQFYVDVALGNPPQDARLMLDLGNSGLFVAGSGCSRCVSRFASYVPSASNFSDVRSCSSFCSDCQDWSAGTNLCSFQSRFDDQINIAGYVATDVFSTIDEELSEIPVPISVIEEVSGFIENTPVSGIFGLGSSSVFQKILTQAKLSNSFSMCLGEHLSFTMGEDPSSLEGINWISLRRTSQKSYGVDVSGVSVAGKKLKVSPISAVMNIAQMNIGLPADLWAAVTNELIVNHNKLGFSMRTWMFDKCLPLTRQQVSALPTISLRFVGSDVSFAIPSSVYAIPSGNNYCFGFEPSENEVILGDLFLQNYHIVIDNAKSGFGIAPISTCPSVPAKRGGVSMCDAPSLLASFTLILLLVAALL